MILLKQTDNVNGNGGWGRRYMDSFMGSCVVGAIRTGSAKKGYAIEALVSSSQRKGTVEASLLPRELSSDWDQVSLVCD